MTAPTAARGAGTSAGAASSTGAVTRTLGERLDTATAGLSAPLVVVDLDALEANATDVVRRAGGTPVRVASKSVRVRHVLEQVLARPGFAGVMAYAASEARWLAGHGVRDVLLGYPTVDAAAVDAVAADPQAADAVTFMVDDTVQADLLAAAARRHGRRLRVCLDVDASLRLGRGPLTVHVGVRRSPVRTPADAAALARAVERRGCLDVRGVMLYEAQIAGLPDTSAGVRLLKAVSARELARRRADVVAAVTEATGRPTDLVNSGGTGSLEVSAAAPGVTEVTAGSGLFAPTLFDGYRAFTPRPAAYIGLDVVRLPADGWATVFGGGYVASGPPGPGRLPRPVQPAGLRLEAREGAGEVQTPLRVPARADLRIGDRVWFRHAKAGEVMERFSEVHLVRGDRVEETVPTYRGEGVCAG
ncbi:alanine racemase [Cellulomonas sp. KH9]|uniref:alanine racemase n=1 Tax=Cellulomonas sp. KH9 TaxID=1855324 RepID=UPI0008DFC583|nr:alanine racemase [Cellulomonas sp. KH9]SFK16981.1 D-serine deaminase, pyridoxal phosphate-dependent [Cellulomonas sp. KH9]